MFKLVRECWDRNLFKKLEGTRVEIYNEVTVNLYGRVVSD